VAGYSGTPLSKKLGIAPPMTLVSIDAPGNIAPGSASCPAA
jgi:hypothetical protein